MKVEIKLPQLVRLEYLVPNPWNPNKVFKPEMELLKLSISKSGFCFPLVVMQESESRYVIVDGFHRHLVAKEFKMEFVSVVVLDEPIEELMAATIRFNRARGVHQVDQMAAIVQDLFKIGMSAIEIGDSLKMDADEVLRLKQVSGFAEGFKDREYSKSWEVVANEENQNVI